MSSNDIYTHQNYFKMTKPKVLGFMIIHYSGDYLKEALLSVRDHVDKMVIAYSAKPSQGHTTDLPCPDLKEDIIQVCHEILGDKLIWDSAESYYSEAEHRAVKYKYAKDFQVILTVDADEIMIDVPRAIDYAMKHTERHFGINGYHNFFRSFEWVLFDGFRPCRIEVLDRDNHLQNLECPMVIYHFSLCQRKEVMEYKYKSFGHASEVRHNYLEEVFYKWQPLHFMKWLHPVSLQIWEKATYFDKNVMPYYLKQHRNYHLNLIP